MIDVAISIVNYKSRQDILDCLASLKRDGVFLQQLNLAGPSCQIIVVDNTPAEGLGGELTVNYPEVIYLPQRRNIGFGAGQNVGVRYLEAKYYFVLNPDTIIPDGELAVQRLWHFMETHPRVGLTAPKLLNYDGTLQYSCYRWHDFWTPLYRRTWLGRRPKNQKKLDKFLMKDFEHNRPLPVEWVMGSAMFIRGRALEETGLFDERFFMYFEDSDLCRRLWEAHWPVYYLGEVKIKHRLRKGSAAVPGVFSAIFKNPLTRSHIWSWLKYTWKWRFLKI